MIAILAIFLQAAGIPAPSVCDRHPPVQRDQIYTGAAPGPRSGLRHRRVEVLEAARQGGVDLNAEPDILGEPAVGDVVVDLANSPGGGDCPASDTRRGRAAAAVGAFHFNGTIHCSGVLIGPNVVATAAHCLHGFDAAKMVFVVGRDPFGAPLQRVAVESVLSHPQYDPTRFGVNDIGVAFLKFSVTEADPLPRAAVDPPADRVTNLMYVGYGIAGSPPGVRRCVDIPVHDVCAATFSNQNVNVNTCNGDSGGGVLLDSQGEVRLVGLTGWGDKRCQAFGVSTKLRHYPQFLGDALKSADEPRPRARVEASARSQKAIGPRALLEALHRTPSPQRQGAFDANYRLRWVRWNGTVQGLPQQGRFDRYCDLAVRADPDVDVLLLDAEGGCEFDDGMPITFEARLVAVGIRGIELVDAEARPRGNTRVATGGPVGSPVATVELVRRRSTTRTATEQRSRPARVESAHGFWSGRTTQCIELDVEAPWRLEIGSIRFAGDHVNHGGVGTPEPTQAGRTCLPMWAEGFGGARVAGLVVDAGQTGVTQGTIQYAVTRDEAVMADEVVETATLTAHGHRDLIVPASVPIAELLVRITHSGNTIEAAAGTQPAIPVVIDWNRPDSRIRVTDSGL